MDALLMWYGKGMRTRIKLTRQKPMLRKFKISCKNMVRGERILSIV